MLFNSFVFLGAFLPITYVVFWMLRSTQARYVWLTATGYVFYGYWDPRFCVIMAFSTLVSYSAGLCFLRYNSRRARMAALIVPVAVDLSLLGFFKYADFALTTYADIGRALGLQASIPTLKIVLPVGISFYTFHTITYIVDSYRGTIKPTRNFFEFAAYVSLFSQLVAGPIVRFRQIETDLEALGDASRTRWLVRGISIFIYGLFEKVVVADALASMVDPAFAEYRTLSSVATWMTTVGYSMQLYFDFCGYSDMAVGLGLMFGLRIPWNFRSPYKALDPADFWRRWHISLSTCLRDYLYIPLGGSRMGRLKTFRNLMLTMMLGGLWHGASWTFVVWGMYHGLLLIGYRAWGRWWDRLPVVVRRAGTFVLVLCGWVFFRTTNLTMAGTVLHRMVVPTPGASVPEPALAALLLLVASIWAMLGPNAQELHDDYSWRRRYGLLLAPAAGMALAVMAGGAASPFLYFQF